MTRRMEALAIEVMGLPSLEALEALLGEPRWDRLIGVRDWYDFLPVEVADAWEGLSRDARLVAFLMASAAAREAAFLAAARGRTRKDPPAPHRPVGRRR